MALSSHLDPALTPIKSPNFFRRDAYARTYACLSAYLPTIDIWNEYKNQNPETLEKPWNTLRKLYQDSNPDISDLTAAIPYTVFPSACSVITEEISASVTITIEISLLRFILQTWSMASATESILLRCPLMRRRYFCYSSKLLITAFSLMLFRSYGNTLASLSMISARKTPPTSLTPAHRLLCRPS